MTIRLLTEDDVQFKPDWGCTETSPPWTVSWKGFIAHAGQRCGRTDIEYKKEALAHLNQQVLFMWESLCVLIDAKE